jgi:hypothetical protein
MLVIDRNEINTMHQMAVKTQNHSIYRSALVCTAAACLLMLTAAAFAASNDEGTYIDSVYSWGIWELGLEPASGPQVPVDNAMNDRSRKLLFRPNDNAAYIAQSIPVTPVTNAPAPPVMPVPTIPSVPTRADPGALPGRGTLR